MAPQAGTQPLWVLLTLPGESGPGPTCWPPVRLSCPPRAPGGQPRFLSPCGAFTLSHALQPVVCTSGHRPPVPWSPSLSITAECHHAACHSAASHVFWCLGPPLRDHRARLSRMSPSHPEAGTAGAVAGAVRAQGDPAPRPPALGARQAPSTRRLPTEYLLGGGRAAGSRRVSESTSPWPRQPSAPAREGVATASAAPGAFESSSNPGRPLPHSALPEAVRGLGVSPPGSGELTGAGAQPSAFWTKVEGMQAVGHESQRPRPLSDSPTESAPGPCRVSRATRVPAAAETRPACGGEKRGANAALGVPRKEDFRRK